MKDFGNFMLWVGGTLFAIIVILFIPLFFLESVSEQLATTSSMLIEVAKVSFLGAIAITLAKK
ncbi:MAG: hypothetical protein KAJ58_00230 [Candidatus Pacebacteria bacterium]|nr:hypothetical protein [Candidatus Paceibacterota bacterium]